MDLNKDKDLEELQFLIDDTLYYDLSHIIFNYNSYFNSQNAFSSNQSFKSSFNDNKIHQIFRSYYIDITRDHYIEDFIIKAFNLYYFYNGSESGTRGRLKRIIKNYSNFKNEFDEKIKVKLFHSHIRNKYTAHLTQKRLNIKLKENRQNLFLEAGAKSQKDWIRKVFNEIITMTKIFIFHSNDNVEMFHLKSLIRNIKYIGCEIKIDENYDIEIVHNVDKYLD